MNLRCIYVCSNQQRTAIQQNTNATEDEDMIGMPDRNSYRRSRRFIHSVANWELDPSSLSKMRNVR